VDSDETAAIPVPPDETGEVPVDYERAQPHYFGAPPDALSAGAAAAAAGAGIVLLATGHLMLGLLLLAAALALGALATRQARRRRATALDRALAGAVDQSRAFASFAGASLSAWMRAGRKVAALRLEATRLARKRSRVQHDLGGAAFAEDEPRVAELKDRMRELSQRIETCAREAEVVVEQARRRTSRERLAVQPTEVREPAGEGRHAVGD
jgi:hypothetical protein